MVFGPFLAGCAGMNRTFDSQGLKFAQVGDEMPSLDKKRFKGMSVRDSLATQDEFEWRVARLRVPGGFIYLEEDFFLHEGINRIRIESDRYRSTKGLKVGMTVSDLLQAASPWTVSPLREHGLFDFYCRMMPGMHFLVQDPTHSMEATDWEHYKPENFDPLAKIKSIVLF
jgi:hypothetical protein